MADNLPDNIKIDDIALGKIEPSVIYAELERLKVEINILRNDMSFFVQALATVPPHQSQHEYYKVVALRLQTVQASIKDYCAQYNRLLPIINLAQIKLGHEVEIAPSLGTRAATRTAKRPSVSKRSGPVSSPASGQSPGQPIVL